MPTPTSWEPTSTGRSSDPGGLTSDDGTGSVQLAVEVERASIPRDDVAELVLAVLDDPDSIGRVWEVVSGPTPIVEAVAAGGSAT